MRPLHDGPAADRVVRAPRVAPGPPQEQHDWLQERVLHPRQKEVRGAGAGWRTRLHLGYFNTAEEAATAYARSEYGRADAAKLLQPRPAPTPAGAEAIRQAEREGLALTASSSSNTGYKGVRHCPKQRGSKKYNLEVRTGGKMVTLGCFATAEEAALFYARREVGKDTLASDLTAPPLPPPPSSTSAELPVYELSILTPEQMAANPTYSPSSNLDYSRARRRGVWRQAHDYAAALAAAPTYGSPSGSAKLGLGVRGRGLGGRGLGG